MAMGKCSRDMSQAALSSHAFSLATKEKRFLLRNEAAASLCPETGSRPPLILPPTWFTPHGDGPVALTCHPASCSHPSWANRASRAQTSLNPDCLGRNHIYWSFAVSLLEQSVMISCRNHSSRYTSTGQAAFRLSRH